MSHTVKLFERIINHVLRTIVQLGNIHFVFRRRRSTMDPSGLCRMKMLPVMILAKYHSTARSAVSEHPNSSARLVSQCPNSRARDSFPNAPTPARDSFSQCSNSNTNDLQFEVCVFGWVFFTIIISFCHKILFIKFMSMY